MRPSQPRLTPLEEAEWTAEQRELLAPIGRNGRVYNIFKTLARYPKLLKRWLPLGNHLLFKSITLNDQTSKLNHYESPTPTNWYGITINYQQDGNYKQQPYSIWLDKLTFSYW